MIKFRVFRKYVHSDISTQVHKITLIRELHKPSKLVNLSLSRSITSAVRHEVWLSEDGKKGNKESGLLDASFPCLEGGAA